MVDIMKRIVEENNLTFLDSL